MAPKPFFPSVSERKEDNSPVEFVPITGAMSRADNQLAWQYPNQSHHHEKCTENPLPLQLEDFGQSTVIDVYLAISADFITVIEMDTLQTIFTCWCSSVIGWTNNQASDINNPTGNCQIDSEQLELKWRHCARENDSLMTTITRALRPLNSS